MLGEGRCDEASAAMPTMRAMTTTRRAGDCDDSVKAARRPRPNVDRDLLACSPAKPLPDVPGLLGGLHDLADKAPRALEAPVAAPDAARLDPESHRRGGSCYPGYPVGAGAGTIEFA